MGEDTQLFLWDQKISTVGPNQMKSKRPDEATKTDTTTKTGLDPKWTSYQVNDDSEIFGLTYQQGVEVEGTDIRRGTRTAIEETVPHGGETKDALWCRHVSGTSNV